MRRSMLFLPGNSPNILLNADFLGSDSIILDLEDAVAPTEKDSARILVRNVIKSLEYTREELAKVSDQLLKYGVDAAFAIGNVEEKISINKKINDNLPYQSAMVA